ncbi:response regulator transcription factor [Streptomyces fodineus]|nr:response regulator transcription factor [Streptomyces fodineus]
MAGKPRRMLVVDDDAASRRFLERGPRLNGFPVVLADGGHAGPAEARTDRPDHNGIDVCRAPLADRDDMPVPMHSAPDGVADRVARPQEVRDENSGTVFTRERPLDQVTLPARPGLPRSYDLRVRGAVDTCLDHPRSEAKAGGRPRIAHTLRGAGFVPRTEGEDRHTQDAS